MKIAVIGYGKSGKSAERLLRKSGYTNITIFDDKVEGCYPVAELDDSFSIFVPTPGIDLNKLNIDRKRVKSEIDIAYNCLKKHQKVIGVTGTNGKSTITHLTAQILSNSGIKNIPCGNIGYTFSDAVLDNQEAEVFVVELSSFQIELLSDFKCCASCVSNITEDHLDRYGNLEAYTQAKLRIVNYTRGSIYALESEILKTSMPEFTCFIDEQFNNYPVLKGKILDFGKYYIDIEKFKLFGMHNLVNLAFSLNLVDCIMNFTGDISELIENTTALPHRCEFVSEVKGVKFINDSKGTNVDSTLVALKSSTYPTVLILGGKDKGGTFEVLVDEINKKVTSVICYGRSMDKVEFQLKGKTDTGIYKTYFLKDAVELAYEKSSKNATVLFSPACASFDQFKNFEERGEYFKQLVKDMEQRYAKP